MKKKDTRRSGLARAMSKLGYCSRSQAVEMIRAGRVQLNGRVCRDPEIPTRVEHDKIVVDDLPLEPAKKIYLMMNKPRGAVTTASDEKDARRFTICLKNQAIGLPRLAVWIKPARACCC